jgi:predicted nucleotide-binding protein
MSDYNKCQLGNNNSMLNVEKIKTDHPKDVKIENGITNKKSLKADNNKVFIVHGHDEKIREAVARFVGQLDLKAIILHEQPNAGRTIIEKLEDSSSDVKFAIVLLTSDDVGSSKDKSSELKPRARQNVIFELGLFIGKLGRKNVCVLYEKEVEILSDYQGVVYCPLDSGGGWRLQLAKELKEGGFDIDMNKVI